MIDLAILLFLVETVLIIQVTSLPSPAH